MRRAIRSRSGKDRTMAKQGQHKRDINDPRVSRGHNNPEKSTELTTGTPKKRETYRKQAALHEDPGKIAQHQQPEWLEDTRDERPGEPHTRARHPRGHRSGSDSNASSGTRGY
jgi:hypothetical protein